MKKKTFLVRFLFVAVLIGIAAVMCVIGRGHTVYFDNKDLTGPDGTVYEAPYQIQVFVDDESAGKLKSGDRGMASVMGQDFRMILHITPEKDAKKVGSAVSLKLPYSLDGVIINLPALLGGAPEDVYMEEFVPAPAAEDADEEVVVTDEFEMPMEDE